ncbi:hypothetical protein RUM44_010046 [Polyplax serrata]|uniref:Uncharacterized protein n=1 Tax=Polyplax serrata TaxID=468196 RepID=A0ABR1AUE0_POLSC
MTNSLQGRTINGVPQRPAIRTPSSIRSNNSQSKVTKMLLIVSTVFVCLNLPSYILRTALRFQESSSFIRFRLSSKQNRKCNIRLERRVTQV